MSTIRTAVYLATQEHIRVDRKTRGTVKCTAGNKRCGSRCIPKDWDCRLKGEGGDSHLKAAGKGSDPLAAIANIQRGITRIGKGILKLNPSELEGGRKAVIRGVVKGTPGDIKRKEEVRSALVQGTIALGALSVAAVGGLRAHGLLMNTAAYRNTIGNKLESGAQKAVNKILDRTPFIGAQRENVRRQGQSALKRTALNAPNALRPDPNILLTNAGANVRESKHLAKALSRSRPKLDESFADWHKRSMQEFYGAPTDGKYRTFTKESTDIFLRDFYSVPDGIPVADIAKLRIREDAERLQRLADQMGIDRNLPTVRRKFADDYAKDQAKAVRDDLYEMLDPNFASQKVDGYYSKVRTRVLKTYDKFYENISGQLRPFYTKDGVRKLNVRQRDGLTDKLTTEHAKQFARRLYGTTDRVQGPYTADLVNHHFYTTRGSAMLRGKDVPWDAPESVVKRAAMEISGSKRLPTMEQAIRIVQSKFPGYRPSGVYSVKNMGIEKAQAVLNKPSSFRSKPAQTPFDQARNRLPKAPADIHWSWAEDNVDEFDRLWRRYAREAHRALKKANPNVSDKEVRSTVYDLLRANGWLPEGPSGDGWPGGKWDSAPRSDAYQRAFLETIHKVRNDKKCGESGIAPEKKCSKKTSAVSTVSKIAAVAGVAAAGAAAVKNKDVIEAAYRHNIPKISTRLIGVMSDARVEQGLAKLPTGLQEQARKLVGKSKQAAAYMSLNAQGYKLLKVDPTNNFSTFASKEGHITSLGTVKDSLLQFNSKRTFYGKAPNGTPIPIYGMQFTVDDGLTQKAGLGKDSVRELATKTKAMYKTQVDAMQDDVLLYAVPEAADGLGAKRRSIYKRFGFRELPPLQREKPWSGFDEAPIFNVKTGGKMHTIQPDQVDWFAKLFSMKPRNDAASTRADKKCGESGIAKHKKCSKRTRNIAIGATAVLGTSILVANRKRIGKAVGEAVENVKNQLDPKRLKERPEDWTDIPPQFRMMGMGENIRERKYDVIVKMAPVKADVISARIDEIAAHKGVIPENVHDLADFVRKENMEIDYKIFEDLVDGKHNVPQSLAPEMVNIRERVRKGYGFNGMYFFKEMTGGNKIFVTPKRLKADTWQDKSKDAVEAVNKVMDSIKNRKRFLKEPKTLQEAIEVQDTFNTYGKAKDDAADLIVGVHELGHAVHDRAEWFLPDTIKVGPKIYDTRGPEFSSILKKNSTYYAMHDNDGGLFGGIPDAGARRETFAENYVYYIFAGERMKQDNPVIYAWVDAIVKKSKAPKPTTT